jgi:hypothetical protein
VINEILQMIEPLIFDLNNLLKNIVLKKELDALAKIIKIDP